MLKSSSSQQRRSAELGGLVFDALGNRFANELGRRDYVTGEMWKNKPPFRLALNKAASDEIVWHCKHCTGRGMMKFYESCATLAQDMGVSVSMMEESIEAYYQASLKSAADPDGGPFPAYPSGKSWDETSGKTGSGKKFGRQGKHGFAANRTHRETVPVDVAGKVLVRCASECHWETEGYLAASRKLSTPTLLPQMPLSLAVTWIRRLTLTFLQQVVLRHSLDSLPSATVSSSS